MEEGEKKRGRRRRKQLRQTSPKGCKYDPDFKVQYYQMYNVEWLKLILAAGGNVCMASVKSSGKCVFKH